MITLGEIKVIEKHSDLSYDLELILKTKDRTGKVQVTIKYGEDIKTTGEKLKALGETLIMQSQQEK